MTRETEEVHSVSGLMAFRVPFVAVDLPDLDDPTIHILATAKACGTTPGNSRTSPPKPASEAHMPDGRKRSTPGPSRRDIALMRRGGETPRDTARPSTTRDTAI